MLLTLLTSCGVLAAWKLLSVWGSSQEFDYDAEVDSKFLESSSVRKYKIKKNSYFNINCF
jgi:hypothetical protein